MALRAWKPSDAVGVTVREFDPSIAANRVDEAGGLVRSLRSSDGVLTATAPSDALRPTLNSGVINGGTSLKFYVGGNANRLKTQTFNQGPAWAAFSVAKQSENTGTQSVIDGDNYNVSTGNRIAQYLRWDGTNVQTIAFTPAVSVVSPSAAQGTNLATKILAASLVGRVAQVSVDGGTPVQSTLNADAVSGSALLTLGSWSADNANFRGDVAIWYLVLGTLSQEDYDRFVGYLAWRFNLVGNLPANHPYKNAAPQIDDGSGGGSDTPASTTDSGTLADTATARAAVALAATDTGALVETLSVSVNVVVSVSDTLVAAETATARAAVTVAVADTGALSDGSVTSSSSSAATSDALVLSDAVGLAVNAVAGLSDALVAVEGGPGVSASAVASAADSTPLSDTSTATASSPGNGGLSDTAALTDASSARADVQVAATDALVASDTATAVVAVRLALSDALVAVDAFSVSMNAVLSASDALVAVEGQPASANARTGTADAGVLSDAFSMSAAAVASLADSWTYNETLVYDIKLPVGNLLADLATLSDVASVYVGVSFATQDRLSFTEAFPVRVGVAFGVADQMTVSDVCSFTVGFWYDVTGGGFPESPWQEL